MKLPKTIQLDISDTNVFEKAAKQGEWAVTGSFSFSDTNPDSLNRKQRLAFQSGWMGLETSGFSTLVQVSTASLSDFETATEKLAAIFVRDFAAPDLEAAMPVARDEVRYVASVGEFDEGTLLSLFREPGPDGLHEIVRAVEMPNTVDHVTKVWELVEE